MGRFEDLTGKQFGKWLVLEQVEDYRRSSRWRCECECGNIGYSNGQYLKDGRSSQCRSCAIKRSQRIYKNELPVPLWGQIKKGAKARNIELSLSKQEAYQILKEQDFYCALSGEKITIPLTNKEFLKRNFTASLDRKDSSQGYTLENIQWVHKDVNRMKSTLQQKRFLELCEAIVRQKPIDHHGE